MTGTDTTPRPPGMRGRRGRVVWDCLRAWSNFVADPREGLPNPITIFKAMWQCAWRYHSSLWLGTPGSATTHNQGDSKLWEPGESMFFGAGHQAVVRGTGSGLDIQDERNGKVLACTLGLGYQCLRVDTTNKTRWTCVKRIKMWYLTTDWSIYWSIIYVQWNIIQPRERRNSCYVRQ